MTETRLNEIEALLRNPPSNGMLAELGLELLAELRGSRLLQEQTVDQAIKDIAAARRSRDGDFHMPIEPSLSEGIAASLVSHERPTPPMGIAVEPHEKKKGKR